jgi:hypothetical protein
MQHLPPARTLRDCAQVLIALVAIKLLNYVLVIRYLPEMKPSHARFAGFCAEQTGTDMHGKGRDGQRPVLARRMLLMLNRPCGRKITTT